MAKLPRIMTASSEKASFFSRVLLLYVCLVTIGGLVACESSGDATRRDPQTLVVIESADATTLDPLFLNDAASSIYASLIFEGLTGTGPNFTVIPWLATSWTHSPDGRHWTVMLRHDVRWSDGEPFDADDVVFTWKTMLDPKVGDPYAGMFAFIRGVVRLDRYRVRFDLSQRNAIFASEALGSAILPKHLLGRLRPQEQRGSSFRTHPIGTGPYMLERWQHDSEAFFVRNPHWWRGEAKIPRIAFRILLSNLARVNAIEDGSADLLDDLSPNDYQQVRYDRPHLRFLRLPDLYTIFVQANLRDEGLKDLEVRRAMMLGWDRDSVVNGLLHGDAQIVNSIEPRALTQWYDPNVTSYPYDPERAKRTLDQAGWRLGLNGVRRNGKGVPLSFEMIIVSGSVNGAQEAAEFQADMREIGIDISIKQLDAATWIERSNSAEYQLIFGGWGGSSDPDEFTFLDSSQRVPVGNNSMGYANQEVDKYLRLGLTTIDPLKRRIAYNHMQEITAATLPVLWGYDRMYHVIYVPRLNLLPERALPDGSLWYVVYDWTLRP